MVPGVGGESHGQFCVALPSRPSVPESKDQSGRWDSGRSPAAAPRNPGKHLVIFLAKGLNGPRPRACGLSKDCQVAALHVF